uniref:Leukocyte immunoglobulin-like receptor subfamily B member 3 n=1 Tax=Peromyscus maniculatus bairdii TaxID=230844 RepID=A0A8C8W4F8_PERMB
MGPSVTLDQLMWTLHKPSIKAEPSSMVSSRSAVIIWCHGTLVAEKCVLHEEGSQKPWGTQTPEKPENKAKFSIPSVTQQHGGQYRCYCYSSAGWSERSDTLEIVVTGIYYYNKPSVTPNSTVHSGDNVTLLCQSTFKVDTFILSKEGAAHQPQRLKSKSEASEFQAEFSMSAVTSDLSGTYRCYGSRDSSHYLLSHASDPVELTVSGFFGASSLPPSRPIPTDVTSVTSLSTTADSEIQDHTVENLIRMGFAVMILIVLGILVIEDWGSQRRAQRALRTQTASKRERERERKRERERETEA